MARANRDVGVKARLLEIDIVFFVHRKRLFCVCDAFFCTSCWKFMMVLGCVVGCSKRSGRDGVGFFRIPL